MKTAQMPNKTSRTRCVHRMYEGALPERNLAKGNADVYQTMPRDRGPGKRSLS